MPYEKTPARLTFEEMIAIRESLADRNLSTKSESNKRTVNNTTLDHLDSQGLPESNRLRSTPDVSFNMGTSEAYENYDSSDALKVLDENKMPEGLKYSRK